ncbi:histamine H2 receptor-like [Montipora capricornis]|uniref:histamine H2 receptor-like n=1 Tax=Montipora capricornis TaxID=246305 RepID=UPI0035F139DF
MENDTWTNGNHTDNESSPSGSGDQLEEDMVFSPKFDIFPITMACLIIATNVTVMVLFIRHGSLRTVTNSFLVSLAASDLLAGLIGIPLTISCTLFGDKFCPPSQMIWRFISVSTVLHILLVSVDRFIAIKYAMRYYNIVTRNVFFVLTPLTWASAAFVTLIQLSWRTNASMDTGEEEDQINPAQTIYELTIFALFFAVPLCIMTLAYTSIFRTVRYHERQIWRYQRPSEPEVARKTAHSHAQRRTAVIFLVMLIVFIICWFPYFILSFLEQFGHEESLSAWVLYVFYYYPRFFTSLSNPLLYVLGKRDFREALVPAVREKNKGRNESRGSATQQSALYATEISSIAVTNN